MMTAVDVRPLRPSDLDAIVFVEWPDAGAGYLPAPTVRVDIEFVSADARLITVSSDDSGLVNALAPACP